MKGGIHWRVEQVDLSDEIGPISKVFDMFEQWMIEYNPVPEHSDSHSDHEAFATTKKSSAALTSAAPKDIRHRRLGHVSMEAVEHLTDALAGVKVIKQLLPTPTPSPCEGCAIANLPHQVSRRPAQRASRAFERVHFDSIQMTRAFNGDGWVMHFLCDKARTHFRFTFSNKSDARDAIKDLTAFVKRHY
jgi:hypothetical protein